jgi:hypothetical protein
MTKASSLAAAIAVLIAGWGLASADPAPGDVFREYMWWNEKGDAGGSLRVGGKHGQKHPDRGWAHDYINAAVVLDHDFDLEHATKAEVVIEKILCHDGTKGLAIEINGHKWMEVPEAKNIPAPQWEYQHHIYPTLAVPLAWLKAGKDNQFRMRVKPEHSWKWPQNLIYGVHFRIYYDPARKPHPTGKITSPESGDVIGRSVELACIASGPNGPLKQVDYIGHYEDVNFEGDGNYRQWHYHFFHGKIMHHLGTVVKPPLALTWDTSWVPDQDQPIRLAARIIDVSGMIYMTEAIDGLRLKRPGISVELCKPYDVPQKWVTRRGRMEEKFDVKGDLGKALAAQLVWVSWSPGYMNGIFVNDQEVFRNEGPKYQYYAHRVTVKDLGAFRRGANTLATGPSPGNQHGMEVNWPGIMVLIQYRREK